MDKMSTLKEIREIGLEIKEDMMSLTENIEYYISKQECLDKKDVKKALVTLIKEYYYLECEEAENIGALESDTALYYGKKLRLPLFRDTDEIDSCDVTIQIVDTKEDNKESKKLKHGQQV